MGGGGVGVPGSVECVHRERRAGGEFPSAIAAQFPMTRQEELGAHDAAFESVQLGSSGPISKDRILFLAVARLVDAIFGELDARDGEAGVRDPKRPESAAQARVNFNNAVAIAMGTNRVRLIGRRNDYDRRGGGAGVEICDDVCGWPGDRRDGRNDDGAGIGSEKRAAILSCCVLSCCVLSCCVLSNLVFRSGGLSGRGSG